LFDHSLLRPKDIKKFKHEESSDDEFDLWNQKSIELEARLRTRINLKCVTRIKDYVATIHNNT